jgi:hypothetical protein
MGVRYNAEKKKIGSYYSTPIYSFRCKCHLCDGWFEIETDPKVRLQLYHRVCSSGYLLAIPMRTPSRTPAMSLLPVPDNKSKIGTQKTTEASPYMASHSPARLCLSLRH